MKSLVNEKLLRMVESGLSIEEASECLGLDVEASKIALASMSASQNDETDADKLREKYRIEAMKALIKIGLDDECENLNARVAALRCFVNKETSLTEVPADKLTEMFTKMKKVTDKYEELSKKEPTTIVIENTNNITKSEGFDEKLNGCLTLAHN